MFQLGKKMTNLLTLCLRVEFCSSDSIYPNQALNLMVTHREDAFSNKTQALTKSINLTFSTIYKLK